MSQRDAWWMGFVLSFVGVLAIGVVRFAVIAGIGYLISLALFRGEKEKSHGR